MLKPVRVFCFIFLLAVLASLLAGWHMLQMKESALAYAHASGKNTLLLVGSVLARWPPEPRRSSDEESSTFREFIS